MYVRHPACLPFALAAILAACASSAPRTSPSQIEVFFTDTRPSREFDELGSVTARHFSVDEGVRLLQREAHELGADAVIAVEYAEFFPRSGRGTTSSTSRRRANEGYQLVMLEFSGVAVTWVEDSP